MDNERRLKMYLAEYSVAGMSKLPKRSKQSSLSLYIYHFAGSVVFKSVNDNP